MNRSKLRKVHADLLAALDLGIEQLSDPSVLAASAPSVSAWSVKDHLEHLSVANDGMVDWIGKVCAGDADPGSPGGPTPIGRILLLIGVIPRGRARAPEATRPKDISVEELASRWRRTRSRVQELSPSLAQLLAATAKRSHFAFGHLTAAQWLRFAQIHNRHHQKIIRDILK